jgi:hemin uptake protein HemP
MRESTMLEPTPTLLHEADAAHAATSRGAAPSRPALPRVESLHLLAGGRELVIQHGAEEYRLRLTRNDKLILTK